MKIHQKFLLWLESHLQIKKHSSGSSMNTHLNHGCPKVSAPTYSGSTIFICWRNVIYFQPHNLYISGFFWSRKHKGTFWFSWNTVLWKQFLTTFLQTWVFFMRLSTKYHTIKGPKMHTVKHLWIMFFIFIMICIDNKDPWLLLSNCGISVLIDQSMRGKFSFE